MKPVNYQSFPSMVHTVQPHSALVCTPKSSDAMYCSKCGFATSDMDLLKKHMLDHMGSKLCCFYCQKAVYSKAELNAHLEEHLRSTFSCPHCGQGYIRRIGLLKHIERVHNKNISQGPKKVGVSKDPQVCNALPSVQCAEPSMRPQVQVNVPSLNMPAVSLVKDGQKARTMSTMLPIASNGVQDGIFNHNRALTVSLPEEVSIPAGCLVELVEVKTVNGSKELKLRLVSQQENEAGMKDTRTTVQQNVTAGKTLASKLNPQNAVKLTNMGMCVVNRKQLETKMADQQCPAVKTVSTSKILVSNQMSKEKATLKRMSQEVINLDSPTKVSKTVCNPVRERNEIPPRRIDPVHGCAKAATVPSTGETSMLTCLLQPVITGSRRYQQTATDERLKSIPEHCKRIPLANAVRTESSLQDTLAAVKREAGALCFNDNIGSKVKDSPKVRNTPAGVNQQSHKPNSLKVPSGAPVRVLPSTVHLCKERDTPRSSFPGPATVQRTVNVSTSVKMPVVSSSSKSNIPAWPQGLPSKQASERDTPKPEGFPVISSVFSLSEQPGVAQGAMQPLVMALRGIVMDKSNTTEKLTLNVDCKDRLQINRTCSSVKLEGNTKVIHQQLPIPVLNDLKDDVKVEKTSSTQTDNCSHALDLKSKDVKTVSKNASDAAISAGTNQQYDISKFLTVPLMRVDERGMWMNSRKVPEPLATQCDSPIPAREPRKGTTIRLMPLKAEQLVTWPGPDQPVVVLNHPKPRFPVSETVDTVADAASPEKAPKCQILKMRLGKVMGQKYEVTGCTVKFSQ
ncbi:uncharacterized protein LOC133485310 [Phyllopteryx taeniolatus]|uniref:uncharacterized protein LOC133485310 n=1 Tax=Phyllopteryx taeniolatus TaxID=161469 RepID=UPI002AD4E412|nr:uncharacterized protein LOC133485310 [Phyllopteryx taeniolatus]XP_061644785.1 uncharacterized protein LOC133485310 [Phyllopteryx taeniolatus]XP_061644786.1 uncharacterized protein LOC133485310 [Phyllopteryx taeniolatus]